MTREEFIKELDDKGCPYEIEGDNLVVLGKIKEYSGRAEGVNLDHLREISTNIIFRNKGYVWLSELLEIPPNVKFENDGYVYANSSKGISRSVEFNNSSWIRFEDIEVGDIGEFILGIKGINDKRLFNKMVSLGLFEK